MQEFADGDRQVFSGDGSELLPGRAVSFGMTLLQLILLTAVVQLFQIESQRKFLPLLYGILGGFVVHAWLPRNLRLPFFALLSVSSIGFYLEQDCIKVLGVGGFLIGICYLPFRFSVRVMLLLVASAVLGVLRLLYLDPALMVLGSMFMFRLIIYMYETSHGDKRPTVSESTAYFFMLPNVCFPFFPVVDFRTFRTCLFSKDDRETWQTGMTWMVHGIIHLLLYRYLRLQVLPEEWELANFRGVVLFMATNYALYLRVSGIFHLITGSLHLFGFHLPRTHHHYFFSASFSDIWRRINIYWKDFMTRLFFFPAFHFMRRNGASTSLAVVAGVGCVFLSTWLLHSWQWFWLLGRVSLSAHEAFLWLAVGGCVAVNAVLDTRHHSRRPRHAAFEALGHSFRIVGMFCLVSLFWAWWWRHDFVSSLAEPLQSETLFADLSVVVMWLAGAVAGGTGVLWLKKVLPPKGTAMPELSLTDSAKLNAAFLGVLAVTGLPQFTAMFDPETRKAITEFRAGYSAEDAQRHLEGYYEELNAAAVPAGDLLTSLSPQMETRREQAQGYMKVSRKTDVFQEYELVLGIRTELNGHPFSVNQYGMRDRDSLTREKPPGVKRIACVGSSIVMGYGISDDAVFTRLIEEDLNSRGRQRYEVLNFGVGKQWATHRLIRMQRHVFRFDPDAVYYFAHQDEFQSITRHIAKLVAQGHRFPAARVMDFVSNTGVTRDMPDGLIQGRLGNQLEELLGAVYQTMVEDCRRRNVVPVWIYLPMPDANAEEPFDKLAAIATEAGFTVSELSDWNDGHNTGNLFPRNDNEHPNAEGHRVIADALLQLTERRPEILP